MENQKDVFYLAGYDPRSYRYYYALLKRNLYKQNQLNGLDLSISPCTQEGEIPYCVISSSQSAVHYHFLQWDKIVQKYWAKSLLDFLYDFAYCVKQYVFSGILRIFIKESKTQLIAGLYPILYFCLSYALGFVGIYHLYQIVASWNLFAAILCALVCVWGLTKIILYGGKKFAVFWLSNIYAFCAKYATGKIIESQGLIEDFSNAILKVLHKNQTTKNYELILCSHSVGTILAVGVAARVVRIAQKQNLNLACFKILTLGQCIPLVSFQKTCETFKEDLHALGSVPLVWFDFTSKIDGACFPMVDFFCASGIQANFKPKFLSPRFHQLFTPQTYKKIRYNWYLAHFLYLYANEILGKYDFFNFIGGKNTLESKIGAI
ncbi:hypothetical protein [Helicobacter sp. MIT 05-5294]|uniref:hypothetical protein n=1 Tax=Helicobacter sp. MIT 05-5294 TaxID=1548150 RepID=UPI00051FDFE8|nr:hypothetical protein [Helicobacter sp. MIT 05-5294]TLD88118.1 hypothetical protein LS69_002330 [Helicobacter sp. MIT 05-5294]